MDRATFLKRAALLAAGVVALGNEELLDRLVWQPKRLWSGADFEQRIPLRITRAYSSYAIPDGGWEAVMSTPALVDQFGHEWKGMHPHRVVIADLRCPPNMVYLTTAEAPS